MCVKQRETPELEVVERPPGGRGFAGLPKRWIVERTDLLAFAEPLWQSRTMSARCRRAKR
jgi:hypothetical protein